VHPEVIIKELNINSRFKHTDSAFCKQRLGLRKVKTKRAQTVIHHAS
jgi:hypothetical protein